MAGRPGYASSAPDMYNERGFAVLKVFDESQVRLLEEFAKDWVYKLLAEWTSGKEGSLALENYHIWSRSLNINHGLVFQAQNRYTYPRVEIEEALINANVKRFLEEHVLGQYRIWDDGFGWLGFRFVRPGQGDGYPFSRKAWGKAKNVISCWIPIIGYDPTETLTLVPGSHAKDYEKYLPTNDKYTRGEYRLATPLTDLEIYNPKLERGEAIFYHPQTLHSEEVKASNITRLNLEFRVDPISLHG